MTRISWALIGLVLLATAGHALGQDRTLHSFRKIRLEEKFYTESAAVGDVNKDGKLDLVAGPFWYEGPDFQKKHAYAAVKEFDPAKGYSQHFLTFVYDIDGDGWVDVLAFGFPGQEVRWYRNPQGQDSTWPMYKAHSPVDSESPMVADLLGNGKKKIICGSGGKVGWVEPGDDPTKPWVFRPVDPAGGKRNLGHGTGVGDVNGDGKLDLIEVGGWWEQPASDPATTPWKLHPAKFGSRPAQMLVYDVNGDGKNDIVTSLDCHGYGLAWFEQSTKDGKEEWTPHVFVNKEPGDSPYGVKFTQHHALELVDVDGDGLQDLITGKRKWAHGPNGDAEPGAPCVLYWFRLARGGEGKPATFVPHLIDSESGVGTQFTVADINGDGLADLLIGNKNGTFVFQHEAKKTSAAEWEAAQPKPAK